jgi:hypothetical protein
MIKVYLAGAMESAGGNFNFPLFDFCAEKLRATGKCEVYNPADLARKEIGSLDVIRKLDKKDLKVRLKPLQREELLWIIDYADIVLLLPGWEHSEGAKLERAVAERFGVKVSYAPDVIRLDEYVKTHFELEQIVKTD